MLAERYRLTWTGELRKRFFIHLGTRLTQEEAEQAIALCLRKNKHFPEWDWFIEAIRGTPQQQAQAKMQANFSAPALPQADGHTRQWHIERLKAKIASGRSLFMPEWITSAIAEAETFEPPITRGELHLTENEITEAARALTEPPAPDIIQGTRLTRLGAITRKATKGMINA